MPIDPRIPLEVQAPHIIPPAEAIGQQLSLRGAVQGQRLQQEQIQAAQMENEERKLQLQDQQTMRQVLQDPDVQGPNGPDWDKAIPKMAGKVSPRTLFSLQQTMLGTQEKRAQIARTTAETVKAQGETQRQQQEHFGNIAIGIQKHNYDPVSTEALLVESEHVNQGNQQALTHIAQLRQQFQQDPTSIKPFIDQLVNNSEAWRKEREVAAAEKNAASRAAQAKSIEDERQTKLPGIQADAEEKQRQNAATKLSAATDRDDYMRRWAALDPKVASAFPHPDQFDSDVTPDVVRKLGMTPAQANTVEHQGVLEGFQKRRLDLEAQRANRERSQTKNSEAADRRLAQREADTFSKSENQLYQLRSRLSNALTYGKTYIDRNGNTKPITTASRDENETADALRSEMEQTYQNVSDELKRTIGNKNDAYARLGSKVRISTDQAHAAIDAGDKKVKDALEAKKNPQPGTGTPPAAAAPAAKPQQQSQAPPISLLKPNVHTTLKNPATGKTEVWTLQNGKPVKI